MIGDTDPFAAIATPEAVAAWLDSLGLGARAQAFAERGWHGQALLAEPEALAEVIPETADQLRLTKAINRLLREIARGPAPALSAAELQAPVAACRRLGED